MVKDVGDNFSIKLHNGEILNLKKLDKLIGKSTVGSIWDPYAGEDHILQKEEVDALKQKFISATANGTINQEELNKIFDKQRATDEKGNKKDFSVNTLLTTMQDLPDDGIITTPVDKKAENNNLPNTQQATSQEKTNNATSTNYKIQPGDTPEKLAEKFGLEGDKAQEFINNLRQQLNGRKYFGVGEDITLLGNQQEKIEQMRTQGFYTDDANELSARFRQIEQNKKIRTNATERRTSSKSQTPKYPTSIRNIIKNVNAAKGEYNLVKNADNTYSIAISGTNYTKQHGCLNYVLKYDEKGNRISQTNNYADGKVLEGTKLPNGKYKWQEKTPIKNDALKMFNTIQKNWHGQAQIAYTKNGYNIVATGTDYEKKNNIANYVYSYNRSGKLLSKTRTYNDGKIQKSIPKNGKDNWITTKEAKEKGYLDRFSDWVSDTWNDLTSSNTSRTAPAKKTVRIKKSSTPTKRSAARKITPKKLSFEDKCRKYLQISELGYPKNIQEQLIKYREQGIGATIEKTRTGFRMTLDEDKLTKNIESSNLRTLQRQANRALPFNKDKKTFDFDKEGNIVQLTQDYQYKTVTTPYLNGKPSTLSPMLQRTEMKEPVQYSKPDASRSSNDRVPADLKIDLPERWKNDKDAQAYVQAFIDNKPELMHELGLTNAQYDNLVSLAFGVTEQETHFNNLRYKDTKGEHHTQYRLGKKMLAKGFRLLDGENHSYGVAQINYWATAIGKDPNDPSIKALRKQLSDFGINSHKDYENNPEKAAIAQLIILNNKRKTAENAEWQNLITQINKRTPNKTDKITTDDITAILYNGAGAVKARMREVLKHPAGTAKGTYNIQTNNSGKLDKNGDILKDGMSYARNVRAYRADVKISSSAASKNRSATLGAETQSNYGELGIVTFMPKAYASRGFAQDTKETVKNIEKYFKISTKPQTPTQKATAKVNNTTLMNKLIATRSSSDIKKSLSDSKIKELLIEAVQNQEVTFGGQGGLTVEEAKSIRVDDAILILKNVASLRNQIAQGNITDKAKLRELAQITDGKFHSSYLQARQVVVNKHDVAGKQVLPGFASPDEVNERLVEHRDNIVSQHRSAFKRNGKGSYQSSVNMYSAMDARGAHNGFKVVANKGINPYFADGTIISYKERELAEVASDIASKDLATGGQCATGIKAAWQSAGIVNNRNEVVYPRNITRTVQAGDTIDSIVNSVGLTGNSAKKKFKAMLINRLRNMAKIDNNGNLIAGRTIYTRANISIKQGDTLDSILHRCGYTKDTPANAKEYDRKLKELRNQLKKDGMLDSHGNPLPEVQKSKLQLYPNAGMSTLNTNVSNSFSFSAKAVIKKGDTVETLASRFGHTNDRARYIANLNRELQQSVALGANGNLVAGKNIIIHSAGEPIEAARDLHIYMDAHPEKFEQVKYVDTGKGQAKELTVADIKKLPAGITGVFIPGKGYEEQSGHAFITNGNGQGYADEVDNLGWANFISGGKGNGKGEHGYVKFYRISARLRAQ